MRFRQGIAAAVLIAFLLLTVGTVFHVHAQELISVHAIKADLDHSQHTACALCKVIKQQSPAYVSSEDSGVSDRIVESHILVKSNLPSCLTPEYQGLSPPRTV